MNRVDFALCAFTPRNVQNSYEPLIERKLLRLDHIRFGLRPSDRIASGTVVVKPNIQKMADKVFEDDTRVDGVDTVIFATGYNFHFAQLEAGRLIPVRELTDPNALLYKLMFSPKLSSKNTLAIIGLIQPTGAIMPISEMQARLFCAQLAGALTS